MADYMAGKTKKTIVTMLVEATIMLGKRKLVLYRKQLLMRCLMVN